MNSARASSRRPIAASAPMYQKLHTRKAVSGAPKPSSPVSRMIRPWRQPALVPPAALSWDRVHRRSAIALVPSANRWALCSGASDCPQAGDPSKQTPRLILGIFLPVQSGGWSRLRHGDAVVDGGGVRARSRSGRSGRNSRGVDILVATPGRLLDLIDTRSLSLSSVQVLILNYRVPSSLSPTIRSCPSTSCLLR
jgi:hypothetical protein